MNEAERENLVTDLANYVAMMGAHQRERMGGRLLLRAFEALKTMRVLSNPNIVEQAHLSGLLASDWKTVVDHWGRGQIEMHKELLTASREQSMKTHGPDTLEPTIDNAGSRD